VVDEQAPGNAQGKIIDGKHGAALLTEPRGDDKSV
jgi:hypothetical protein